MTEMNSFFKKNPRVAALNLIDDGDVSARSMLEMALNWMSNDDVREMLDANELSPRFLEEEEDEEEWDCECGATSVLDCTCTDEDLICKSTSALYR